MRRIRTAEAILVGTLILIAVCMLAILISTYINDRWRFINDMKIQEYGICERLDDTTNKPVWTDDIIPSSYSSVNVCGLLVSSIPIELSAVVYKDTTQKPVLHRSYPSIDNGYFIIAIPLPKDNRAGSYFIDLYFQREVLAKLSITVE